ncbi:MAG TPA: prolyl oligopeptidase family serine peptidase [Casimicrobiaceae bacterium]|nr:prolyl oligopeptidase family serine peptidase [Casimicrobiaceae bacterium]
MPHAASLVIALALMPGLAAADAETHFFPPQTPARPVVDVLHGTTLTDRYRWLENGKDEEVATWTRAQHAATLRYLDRHAPPVPGMTDELSRYFDRDRTEPPLVKHGRQFFQRTRRGQPQAALYTRVDGRETLLLDPVALDPSGKTKIGDFVPNRDASKLAVGVYAQGTERKDYRIIDSTTGAQIGPVITGLDSFGWARDERYAFITPRTAETDAKQTPMHCFRHRLGGDRKDDVLMLAVDDAKNYCSVYEPEDADVTVFETGDFWSNTIRVRPIDSNEAPRTIYSSREFRAEAIFRRDRIYFRTNDHAPNWKLMAANYAKPAFADWTTLIPEQRNVLAEATVTREFIVATRREDVLSRLDVYDHAGSKLRELALPEFGNVSGIAYDLDDDRAYATLASYTSSSKLYGLDGKSLAWSLVWQDDPPLDLSQIEAERVYVPARDGARIPVFVVHRKDMKKDGANPTLLHVYGGFDITVEPFYLGSYSSFVNRGGVFVDAGVRGGGEYGEKWHEEAMLARKQNTFDDTIAVAEWLVREGYTKPSKLAVEGGSNGGLTVGAVLTQRPDLFAAAICQVPLLDMVRYQKFLIARYWIPEYGDPSIDADFRWILRYSPYQNVRAGVNLPPTLVVAGEYDSRVDPMHAKKFVAEVQNHPGQVSPFLLYMDFDSGHGTGKTQQQRVVDRDYELRFLMEELGMSGDGKSGVRGGG